MLEALVKWFIAVYVYALGLAFFLGILTLALSPVIAVLYFVADWCERKKNPIAKESKIKEKECSKIHYT